MLSVIFLIFRAVCRILVIIFRLNATENGEFIFLLSFELKKT